MNIFDVFQPGLYYGSERLSFDPSKQYAYVEHPIQGWRVYLRSCAFLHQVNKPFHPYHFLVVKKTGKRYSDAAWEPPKGQMEGKDISNKPMVQLLAENALREIQEESHITHVIHLQHTGLVFQSQEKDYPPNHFFQYHLFSGKVSPDQISQSFDTFQWIKEHPKGFARWSRDRKEKDAVSWFYPRKTRLNPRWTPDIVALYLRSAKSLSY
jgi:hypothetical protein